MYVRPRPVGALWGYYVKYKLIIKVEEDNGLSV